MHKDHKERTREEFSRQASQLLKSDSFTDTEVLARIAKAAEAAPGRKLLDVGCGPGIVVEALARRGATVTGLDLTPTMLANARKRCEEAGLANVDFHEGEADNLPFSDETFDGVVSRLTIHHFENPREVLDEMRRVLRPGGRLVIADIVSPEDPDKAKLHNALETLRDPTHVQAWSNGALIEMIEAAEFALDAVAEWLKPRTFDEWIAITSAPERVGPVGAVMEALARGGVDAGIGLRIEEGQTAFDHAWVMVTAHKR